MRAGSYSGQRTGPLRDVRVLDLSRLVAGNMLTHVFADFGADVLKIERPGVGDDLRNWRVADIALVWKVYARNKRSLTLDLRQDAGRNVLLSLVEGADILIERFVPLSASMQSVAERLFHAIGRPDLIADPRFATNEARVANDDLLDPIVANYIGRLTREEALAHFSAAGVTVGPILDVADIVRHPYVIERELLTAYPDEEIGSLPMHHVSPRLDGTPGAVHSPAPALGADTDEVLADLGIGKAAATELRARGVV